MTTQQINSDDDNSTELMSEIQNWFRLDDEETEQTVEDEIQRQLEDINGGVLDFFDSEFNKIVDIRLGDADRSNSTLPQVMVWEHDDLEQMVFKFENGTTSHYELIDEDHMDTVVGDSLDTDFIFYADEKDMSADEIITVRADDGGYTDSFQNWAAEYAN